MWTFCFQDLFPSYSSDALKVIIKCLTISSGLLADFGVHSSNARTRGQFKPRNANKGTNSYHLRQFAEATLGSGSLRKAVRLPAGEDLSEWLAVNG